MKRLLDTHMLLWAAAGVLPEEAEAMVTNGDNTLYTQHRHQTALFRPRIRAQ